MNASSLTPDAIILNDVHSQLNPTRVSCVRRPQCREELQQIIQDAAREGCRISVSGGRHAMGGQQFATDLLHLDLSALTRVLDADATRGLLHIEAGADWPAIIAATHSLRTNDGHPWSIRQKQTGVDAVTLGGSISANAHGRGMMMGPLVDDIEDLTLIDSQGELVHCHREKNAELFSLVIGGYGLFGIIYSATLRLMPRQRLERVVDVIDLDDAVRAVYRRAEEGCVYGDFQFAIDTEDPRFLRRGVFACYRPVATGMPDEEIPADLPKDTWLELLRLAHENKREAFRLYAQYYVSTDGKRYWSDSMQLSTYIPTYAEFLEQSRTASARDAVKETLVIGEHYVPRDHLLAFMTRAKEILLRHKSEVIYGTIRAIQKDNTTFLPWAKDDFVCVIFNLRTPHTEEGRANTAKTFRALIDASNDCGGCFFLTYHRHATARQVETAYPNFREWLQLKRLYDPQERFTSDWYQHYKQAFAQEP
jgi:FAD/FMN-containing dehydrogenase